MTTYLFLLGQTPELSFAELLALRPQLEWLRLLPHVVSIQLPDDTAALEIFNLTGGTVKLAKLLQTFPAHTDVAILTAALMEELQKSPIKNFGISEWGRDHLPPIEPAQLKQDLKKLGFSKRFIDGPRTGLSAAILTHQTVNELTLVQEAEEILLIETLAAQPIDIWTERDRSKPYSDRKKGMLPPKVARIMVNLALGEQTPEQLAGKWLYDPFCGTGTVLIEAALRGINVIGSDLDRDASTGTDDNLAWLKETYQLTVETQSFKSDVSSVKLSQLPQPIEYLVTEPFLGKPTPVDTAIPNIVKGLEKLYWGAFRNWRELLAPGARIVIVLPRFETAKQSYHFKHLIDKLAELGYTTSSEPVEYARPQAIVHRQIYQLIYQPKG